MTPGRVTGLERQRDGTGVADLASRLDRDEIARLMAAFERAPSRSAPRHLADRAKIDHARDRAHDLADLRRRRDRMFGQDLFSDHAWDMLIALFLLRAEGRSATAEAVCAATSAPVTTAVRYLALLIGEGWVAQAPGPSPGQHVYVELGDTGFARMIELLTRDGS